MPPRLEPIRGIPGLREYSQLPPSRRPIGARTNFATQLQSENSIGNKNSIFYLWILFAGLFIFLSYRYWCQKLDYDLRLIETELEKQKLEIELEKQKLEMDAANSSFKWSWVGNIIFALILCVGGNKIANILTKIAEMQEITKSNAIKSQKQIEFEKIRNEHSYTSYFSKAYQHTVTVLGNVTRTYIFPLALDSNFMSKLTINNNRSHHAKITKESQHDEPPCQKTEN